MLKTNVAQIDAEKFLIGLVLVFLLYNRQWELLPTHYTKEQVNKDKRQYIDVVDKYLGRPIRKNNFNFNIATKMLTKMF